MRVLVVVGMFHHLHKFVNLAIAFTGAPLLLANTSSSASGPTVTLDQATVLGTTNGSVTSYIGIPYAQPP